MVHVYVYAYVPDFVCVFDVFMCMIVFMFHVDVCHYVFDHVNVSVYCLTFLWMFISPFSQCLLYLLCV